MTVPDHQSSTCHYEPVSFDAVPGWNADDHGAALSVLRSAGSLYGLDEGTAELSPREFLETHFVPHRVVHEAPSGLLTGYYEPVLQGSRERSDRFPVPLYLEPHDLVKIHDDSMRGHRNDELVAGQMVDGAIAPYFTRREIENGALAGRGLEFMFLADPIDAYFLHVQGAGRIELEDGESVRVGFAAKNGLPYTSIGRRLIECGEVAESDMSLEVLRAWLETHPDRAAALMWENKSFIFFREHDNGGVPSCGPTGSLGVPLTAGRSLAIDTSYHALGTPVFVSSREIVHHGEEGFHRLMVAQDVGSAIRGPERGDIFWGTGDVAGQLAGATVHAGNFFVLLRCENCT